MKRMVLFVFAILAMAALLFATASPVAAASGDNSIRLVSATYIPGKGVVFTFHVTGDFNSYDGFVVVNGQTYQLNCNVKDSGDVACTADRGLGNFVGMQAQASLNGFAGSVLIRASYCYQVYDYPAGSNSSVAANWVAFTTFCQSFPAQNNDRIRLTDAQLGYSPSAVFSYYYQDDLAVCAPSLPYGAGYAYGC